MIIIITTVTINYVYYDKYTNIYKCVNLIINTVMS